MHFCLLGRSEGVRKEEEILRRETVQWAAKGEKALKMFHSQSEHSVGDEEKNNNINWNSLSKLMRTASGISSTAVARHYEPDELHRTVREAVPGKRSAAMLTLNYFRQQHFIVTMLCLPNSKAIVRRFDPFCHLNVLLLP